MLLVLTPLPVPDLRQVLTVFVDVLLMLDELILDHLLQIGPIGAQLRQAINHVLHQVEPVQGDDNDDTNQRVRRSMLVGSTVFLVVTANQNE